MLHALWLFVAFSILPLLAGFLHHFLTTERGKRWLLRRARDIAHKQNRVLIPAEELATMREDALSLHQFVEKSGFIRNLKTGAGKKAEEKIRSRAHRIWHSASASARHHSSI